MEGVAAERSMGGRRTSLACRWTTNPNPHPNPHLVGVQVDPNPTPNPTPHPNPHLVGVQVDEVEAEVREVFHL